MIAPTKDLRRELEACHASSKAHGRREEPAHPPAPDPGPSLARRWVRFADAHRGRLLLACALLGIAGAAGSWLLYSDLRPDISELLPASARSARDLDEVSARVGGWAEEAVIVTGADAATLKRFADDLDAQLTPFKPKLIRWTEYRIDDLADFFKKRQWLFPKKQDLEDLRKQVAARVRWEKQRANPLFVSNRGRRAARGGGRRAPPGRGRREHLHSLS